MLEEYANYLKIELKLANNTVNSYISDISIFEEYLGSIHKELKDINKEDIRNYLKYLDEKNYKNSSINRILSSLNDYYEYLLIKGVRKDNPFLMVYRPKKKKVLPNFISYEEYMRLISTCLEDDSIYRERNILLIEILFACGIRVSELVSIRLSSIDKNEKSIRILGKGSKERIVFYGEYASIYLEEYLSNSRNILLQGKKCDYLFINKQGNLLTRRGVEDIIQRIANKSLLKQKITPHTFRHSYATQMLNNGADIRSVQELLGHASLSTTGIYTHVTNDVIRREYLKAFKR